MVRRKARLEIKIGSIKMKNPVMLASGTYEYNETTRDLIDVKKLGAIVTKTVTLKPEGGNPPPRTCETHAGMLNAIGLQNKGINSFLKEILPELKKLKVPLIVSIAGKTKEEFRVLSQRLDKAGSVAGIELNLSCPNIRNKKLIAQDKELTYEVVGAARKATKKTLIAKLSPNVTDIVEIAKAAEAAGADALSLVNSFPAMAIDIETKKPKLGNITGGLSGPAIKPIALKMVWETSKAAKIPIVGTGGIVSLEDAIEFLLAGASVVAIGTGNLVDPKLGLRVADGIKKYMKRQKL
jgi:dihydroorotate dehydrogenase (NAD+) catalytic subunit